MTGKDWYRVILLLFTSYLVFFIVFYSVMMNHG